MAESDEPGPSRKKFKTCSPFETLHEHKKSIKEAIERLETFIFCFVKLVSCNGDFSTCFSNAWCASSRNIEEENVSRIAKFDDIYDTGFLLRVLNEQVTDLNETQRIAFKRLGLFFENIEDINKILLESISENTSEADLAGLIGTHVLKQLAVDQQMTFSDSGYSNKKAFCCCKSTKCKSMLKYGDTSLGHPRVWHGSVDIMLGSVAVEVVDDIEDTEEDGIYLKTNNFEQHRSQLIAETIVFGFVQKQGRVPLIAISKGQVKLYLYDPDNDLLYESMECDMFVEVKGTKSETLSRSIVLLLWLTLNYQIFFKGLDPSHVKNAYTSEFKTLIKERVLYIYENELKFGGCKHAKRSKKPFLWFEYGKYKYT